MDERDWQSIETAPKDVRRLILIWDEDVAHPVVGNWSENHQCYVTDYGGRDPGLDHDLVQYRIEVPTHWTELPGTPSDIEQFR